MFNLLYSLVIGEVKKGLGPGFRVWGYSPGIKTKKGLGLRIMSRSSSLLRAKGF